MSSGTRVPVFNLFASAYDLITDHVYWRDQIARMLAYAGAPSERLRVLDLGCGPGVSTFVLAQELGPGASLVGVDLSRAMITRANRHAETRFPELENVRFEQADATRLAFADGAFDLAVGHSFLYLVSDRDAVLREVRRVLAPGGTLVLMEPHDEADLLGAAASGTTRWREAVRHPWDASRFAAAMVAWRLVSTAARRMPRLAIERAFCDAGFTDVATHPTLAGLGLHCVGRAAA